METTTDPAVPTTAAPIKAFCHTNSQGKSYYLHCRVTTAGSGKKVNFYYFGKVQKDLAVEALPEGYEIIESSNMPFLRRKLPTPTA